MNLYMFRAVPLPVIRSPLTAHFHWYMSYGLKTASEHGRDGRPCSEAVFKPYDTYRCQVYS